jgi:TRAP-type C4-dicarboxylate transport system permease large subunit
LRDNFDTESPIYLRRSNIVKCGVYVLIATDLGSITPPVALNIFALKGVTKDVPIGVMYMGILPFVVASILILLIIFFIPSLSTWLPKLLKQYASEYG